MSPSNKRLITMEGTARKVIKRCFQFVNLILCIVGITILIYSVWMILVVFRQYRRYLFSSWFLWASIITGIIFCFTSCIGYAGAAIRSKIIISFYIFCIFLVLLAEILVIGDVSLNKAWIKDFPKDPAHRLEDFMIFVNSHLSIFKYVVLSIFLLQVFAFVLAMALNELDTVRSYLDSDAKQVSAGLPFLAHKVGPTSKYSMGHPLPDHDNVDDSYTVVKINSMSSGEKEAWLMSTCGCPPPTYD